MAFEEVTNPNGRPPDRTSDGTLSGTSLYISTRAYRQYFNGCLDVTVAYDPDTGAIGLTPVPHKIPRKTYKVYTPTRAYQVRLSPVFREYGLAHKGKDKIKFSQDEGRLVFVIPNLKRIS
jgi:hypothetical protein